MVDGLGGALGNLGFVLQAAGAQDPSAFIQRRRQQQQLQAQQQQQQQALSQLPAILSGTNIPAFRRRELGTPEAIEAERQQDLLAALSAAAPQQFTQAATAQAFPKAASPVTLRPGEQLVQPTTGEVISRAPATGEQKAKARKFNLEADKLQKQLEGGLTVADPKVFDNTSKLRKEFTNLSKDFIAQRDAFGRVQASAQDPSAAGDIALIFNFMKTLDPGSVVREGEFATAQNSGGIPESIRARYNKAIRGERLTPKIRKDFVDRATILFAQAQRQHDQRVGTFSTLAVRSGLPADQVVLDLGLAQEQAIQDQEPTQDELLAEAVRRGLRQ